MDRESWTAGKPAQPGRKSPISPGDSYKRTVLLVAAVLVACGLFVESRPQAADSENITWGAHNPTWSPDSKRLAFSLFGSIWEAGAEGGAARQITSSGGYHAHPAWSPRGDKVAFVRGLAPAGRTPLIAGTLALADVSTGEERDLKTPFPAAGTPAWSPDGSRIVCGLRSPDVGVLLYEIEVQSGVSRLLHQLPQGQRGGASWIDAAWNPKRGEIFFVAARGGPAQIWSIAPAGPPVAIQLPLTRYRREDIAQLDSLSALPDGSGIVYSAVVVNGKGDYELYRLPREGGQPVAITNTTRDEFAPAVSPDGSSVAFVSNRMGNIDLFTMPLSGGEARHVRLAPLRFKAASGRLRVRVQDELGVRTPVRLYVRASDRKAYCPSGVQIFYYGLEPGQGREGFFVSSGDDTFPVPAGRVELTALKGVEYEPQDRSLEVAAGETTEVTISMNRWTNWNQRGWYTGENHFHANYNGSYYQSPPQSLAWLEAEDLNTANMIVANSEGAFIHDKEFFRGGADPISKERYVLYWGQEYRNHYPLGHMAFLNIRKQVPPSFTSVPGSSSPYDYPLNTMAALEARKQNGLVSYVHPAGPRDVFDTQLGAKEGPVTAALGAMDSIDIMPFGPAAAEMWYRFLNSGFHMTAGAGTDVFTNWRGINSIPGGAREYVEIGGAMNWDRWVERLRAGRNFVTNGPLLTFNVNGEPIGAVIRAPSGQPYRARIGAEVTARTPLRRVELVQNGSVIESRELQAGERALRLEKEVEVNSSCWFAVRAEGVPARGVTGGIPRAHSGAIYVEVGGSPVLIRGDVELMVRWVDRLWALLEERDNFGSAPNREKARQMIAQARQHYVKKLAAAK